MPHGHRYVEQLAGAGGAWPPSKRVGHGMDVAVRCEGGGYVRAWLTVEGLHAPSRRPRDCCFVGTLVFMQGTRRTQQRRVCRRTSTPLRFTLAVLPVLFGDLLLTNMVPTLCKEEEFSK